MGNLTVIPDWLDARLNYLRSKARRHRAAGELAEAQACELEAKHRLERFKESERRAHAS